ncbi:hypothetical protein F511_12443 [Dorcoceras hygrometricum]|uniref:Retrotransposon gag domain-containing protein n=1 Tax=Dorcoceras hygrometricum TaxID=472368 RepID=A0A2Z7DGW1_9LAMI|nr:hypothetical protein F511_12443 [Dorcoceras hygrometricum]
MAQLLECLVDQSSLGNGQSTGRLVSCKDPQERFRQQCPQEFSGGMPVLDYILKFERGCYFVPLTGRDVEEKLRHFVDGLRPTLKHDVRLAEPTDYRAAVNKDQRSEQDWKETDEERQSKRWKEIDEERQAFQNKDRRQSKRPNNNQQMS